jgi:hypothetical protein
MHELVAAHQEDSMADISALEMLFGMQQYSLPTRLLDLSMNPLDDRHWGIKLPTYL